MPDILQEEIQVLAEMDVQINDLVVDTTESLAGTAPTDAELELIMLDVELQIRAIEEDLQGGGV